MKVQQVRELAGQMIREQAPELKIELKKKDVCEFCVDYISNYDHEDHIKKDGHLSQIDAWIDNGSKGEFMLMYNKAPFSIGGVALMIKD